MTDEVTAVEREFLQERFTSVRRGDPSVAEAIIAAVCETFLIERESLMSESRTALVSEARDCAAFLLRERSWTYEEIGRALGRDWNSMRSAVQRMRGRMKQKLHRDVVTQVGGQAAGK